MEPHPPQDAMVLYANTGQSAIGWRCWGFHTVRGGINPGELRFRTRVCGFELCIKGFMIRRWEPILPGMRWLYGRARANQRSASGAGVSKPWGAVSTGGSSFSSPGFRSCKDMEGFLIQGWGAIGWWGLGFHTVRVGIDPGGHRFRPRFVGAVDVWRDF